MKTDTSWIKLKLGFFGHAKFRYMLKKHGPAGPLAVLAIWSQMMENDGVFDANKDFNIDKIADTCGIENSVVFNIISSALHCDMLTTAQANVYHKSKITETLKTLESLSERGKKGGIASSEQRKVNPKSSRSQQQVEPVLTDKNRLDKNIQSPRKGDSAIALVSDAKTATLAPLWARFAEKYNVEIVGEENQQRVQKALERNQKGKYAKEIRKYFEQLSEPSRQDFRSDPVKWAENVGGEKWIKAELSKNSEENAN